MEPQGDSSSEDDFSAVRFREEVREAKRAVRSEKEGRESLTRTFSYYNGQSEASKPTPSYIDLPPFAKTGQESRPATYLPLNVPSRPTEEQEDITASVSHFMNFPRVSATSTSRSAGTRERTVLEGRKKEKHQTRVMDSKKKHVIKDKKQKKKEKKHKGTPSSSSSSTSNSSSSESSTSSPLTSAGQAET